MTVVILEDAAEDIEAGRHFYESREPGIGEYFVESVLSDLGSLVLYAGIHPYISASSGCSQSASRLVFIMKLKARQLMFTRFWTCGAIRFGFEASCASGDSEPAACTGLRGHIVLDTRRHVRAASEAERYA